MKKYLNQQDMKDRNSTNVFRLIRKQGPLTRRQIEAETGLSWGAVSNVTARLLELGYVRERRDADAAQTASAQMVAGRTPIYLEADDETYFVIGLDLNGAGLRAVRMNLCGEVVDTVTAPACHGDRETLLQATRDLMRAILDGADGKRVLCVGVAIQGEVDAQNGISIRFPRCRGWHDVPLATILEEEFGLPTFLEHDPNCTLFAHSAPSGLDEAILLRIDSGIGMAVMMNGRIFERLGAFELGHTCVRPQGALCACGSRGCLELYASMTGLSERAGVPFDELADRARHGDADTVAYFREMAECLALATVNAARLLNVRTVVLCGDMLEMRDLFYDRLIAESTRLARDFRLSFSVTDVANAALGGAMIALERYSLHLEG